MLIDEIPNPARRRAGTVNILLRYSLPVFFAPAGATPSSVAWSVEKQNGVLTVTGKNSGGRSVTARGSRPR